MQFQQPFQAGSVEPSFGFPLAPAGDYPVVITESNPEETKDKTGGMLVLWLEVINHPQGMAQCPQAAGYVGHKFRINLNLFNQNQQASKIAWGQLSAICTVTGVGVVQDSSQLHNIPFIANVSNDGQYNNVKSVKFIDGRTVGKGSAPAATQPPLPGASPFPPQPPNMGAAPGTPAFPPQQPAWGATQPQVPAAPPWGMPSAPPAAPAPSAAPPWQQQQAAPPAAPAQPQASAAPPWAQPVPAAPATWQPK